MQLHSHRVQRGKTVLFLAALGGLLALPASANTPVTTPNNLLVVNGSAATSGGGTSNLTVTTTTNNVVLSWTNFWDGTANGGTSTSGDTITYTLPSATSSILNQVTGPNATTIAGKISSNGNVYLINPNGVTITGTGVVQTAGFYVSTYLEPLSTFESSGTLAIFGANSASLAGNLTGTVTLAPQALIQTIGGSGSIGFAANSVNVSTVLYGSTLLVDGGANPGINLGTAGPATIEGPLTLWANGGLVYLGAAAGNDTSVQGATTITANAATSVNVGWDASTVLQGAVTINSDGGTVSVASLASGSTLVQNNLTINSGAGQIVLSTNSGTVVQGNLSLTAAGEIGLTNGSNTTVDGNTTITSSQAGGNAVVQAGGLFTANLPGTTTTISTTTGNVNLTDADLASIAATSTSGNVSITDLTADPVNLAASNIGTGSFSINAAWITSSGTVTAANFSATQNSGNLAAPAANVSGAYSLTATNGSISGGGNVTAGTYALAANTTNGTVSFATTGPATYTALSGSSVNVSASGNVTLAPASTSALDAASLTVTSTGGNITDAGSTVALTLTHNDTMSASGSVTLGTTSQADSVAALAVTAGSGGFTLYDSAAFTLANGTNISGPAAITGLGLTFGANSSDTITIGGALSYTGTGNVATVAGTLNIAGNVTIADPTAAAVGLGTSGGSDSFGQISLPTAGGSAPVTIYESATTNLGAITSGSLAVTSTGNIENPTGAISTGAVTLSAGTTSSPGTIQLGTTTTPALTTGITINNGSTANLILTGADANVALGGAITGLWIDSTTAGTNINATFNAGGSLAQFAFTSSGAATATLGAPGTPDPVGVTLWNAVDGSTAGETSIYDAKSITLGSGINLNSTAATSLDLVNSGTGAISDTASSPIYVYGGVTFQSGGAINVSNNTASSLGALTFDLTGASNNGNLTYVEGATVNVGTIAIANATYTGTVSLSSVTGGIIQSGALTIPSATAINFSAPKGSVTIGNPANAFGGTIPIGITAAGASVLNNDAPISLGNVSVGSTLSVSTETSGGGINQVTGTSIDVYGNPTFVTDSGAITLVNAGNNFGALNVDSTDNGAGAGANISIVENATDHYHAINTGTGNFYARATQGDIIEDPTASVYIGGTASLTSTSGNVTWTGDNNTIIGALTFVAPGNVTIDAVNTGADPLTLGGTQNAPLVVGGNLTLNVQSPTSAITDGGTGAVDVTGTSSFIAGSGGISLTGAHSVYAGWTAFNTAGPLTFTQAGSITLASSSVNGAAVITSSSGNFTNSGTSTFFDTLTINALSGSIIFAAPINVNQGLQVNSNTGPVNLSVDSKSANLNGEAPTGTGTALSNYTPPSP